VAGREPAREFVTGKVGGVGHLNAGSGTIVGTIRIGVVAPSCDVADCGPDATFVFTFTTKVKFAVALAAKVRMVEV